MAILSQLLRRRDADIRKRDNTIEQLRAKIDAMMNDNLESRSKRDGHVQTLQATVEDLKRKLRSEEDVSKSAMRKYRDFEELHKIALRDKEVSMESLRSKLTAEFDASRQRLRNQFENDIEVTVRKAVEAATAEKDRLSRQAVEAEKKRGEQDLNRIKTTHARVISELQDIIKTTRRNLDDERRARRIVENDREVERRQGASLRSDLETKLEFGAKAAYDAKLQVGVYRNKVVVEEAQLQLERTSHDAAVSELAAKHRGAMSELAESHRKSLNLQLQRAADAHAASLVRLEERQRRRIVEIESRASKVVDKPPANEVSEYISEIDSWKQRALHADETSKSWERRYDADLEHKQRLLAGVQKDLGELAHRFAAQTEALRKECSAYKARADLSTNEKGALLEKTEMALLSAREATLLERRHFEAAEVTVSNLREREEANASAAKSESERERESREAMQSEFEDLRAQLVKEQAEWSEKERTMRHALEVATSARKSPSSKHATSDIRTPPRAPELNVAIPGLPSPTFSEDMGPISPLPPLSELRGSPPRQSSLVMQLRSEIEEEKREKLRNRDAMESMKRDMENARKVNAELKSAIGDMRSEMERVLRDAPERAVELHRELAVVQSQLQRSEEEREKLMNITKRRRWRRAHESTYDWARSAWSDTLRNAAEGKREARDSSCDVEDASESTYSSEAHLRELDSSEEETFNGKDEICSPEEIEHHRSAALWKDSVSFDKETVERSGPERLDQIARLLQDAVRAKRLVFGNVLKTMGSLWLAMDRDGSGTIDMDEFSRGMRRIDLGLTKKQLRSIFAGIDTDENGVIDHAEFVLAMKKRVSASSKQQQQQQKKRKKKEKKKVSQRSDPLPVKHSNALLRAMGVHPMLAVEGLAATTTRANRAEKSKTCSDRATESQRQMGSRIKRAQAKKKQASMRSSDLVVEARGIASVTAGTNRRKIRNYNIRDSAEETA
eukprot:g320.t1